MKIMRSDFCKIAPEMITTFIVAAGNYAIQVPVLVERQLLHPNIWKERKETNLHYPGINGFWSELNVFRSYTSFHELPIYLCFLGVSVPVGGGYAGFYGVLAAMRGWG
ncbi:hypothetical protein Hanom_Chr08g00710831 [Helianthus anomalus]